MEDEIRKVIIENLFACTEPTELKKERVLEIANEITPFVTKVVKEQMNKDSVSEDLEKELEDFLEKNSDSNGFFNPLDVAKHFFELGLKAQNITTNLKQRISVLKMEFWTGLQTFENSEMTLSDAYNQGVDDILEELGLEAQKGE